MDNIFTKLQHLAEEAKQYVNVKIDLVKLDVAEKVSGIIADSAAAIVSAIIFLFFLLFASIGLALFLSSIIGKPYAGFLIVGSAYLIIGLIIWYKRRSLIQLPIMNNIIRQLFDDNRKNGKD